MGILDGFSMVSGGESHPLYIKLSADSHPPCPAVLRPLFQDDRNRALCPCSGLVRTRLSSESEATAAVESANRTWPGRVSSLDEPAWISISSGWIPRKSVRYRSLSTERTPGLELVVLISVLITILLLAINSWIQPCLYIACRMISRDRSCLTGVGVGQILQKGLMT